MEDYSHARLYDVLSARSEKYGMTIHLVASQI